MTAFRPTPPGWLALPRLAATAALCLGLAACGGKDGPYEAFLLLVDERGDDVEFALGGRNSFEACADLGAYEASNYDGGTFWANPTLIYGRYRKGDDWRPYRVQGFACRRDHDA